MVIDEFTMDDFAVVHVLWQRSDLWMRPSDGREQVQLKMSATPTSSWSRATPTAPSWAR